MIRNSLTGKQKSFLRSLGMKLEPVVNIGKEGLTPTVVAAAREVIRKRELIKVRVLQNCAELPKDIITILAERADANLVQVIGRNGLLYRKNEEKPKIELP
ncbi:MAG: ribosome assembly RNA-binding protein YhbY [Selenomonadaceae bacterium]|nr:ribosome assembly RNA-binding protein YhbY [Selenomonadaceae bacterium]MBQ3971618.1 ribosome assembly RNA-binding protein YhbY [Selenomonadaceae bacterium]